MSSSNNKDVKDRVLLRSSGLEPITLNIDDQFLNNVDQWSYRVRNRAYWRNMGDVVDDYHGQSKEVLTTCGVNQDQLQSLGAADHIEVSFDREQTKLWKFPWEFVIVQALRDFSRKSPIVTRHMKGEHSAPSNGKPYASILYLDCKPPVSERLRERRFQASRLREAFNGPLRPVEPPSRNKFLEELFHGYSDIVHMTGFDFSRAARFSPQLSKLQNQTEEDGFWFGDPADQQSLVSGPKLQDMLRAPRSEIRLLVGDFFYSGHSLAGLIGHGAHAAVVFQDSLEDVLSATFFPEFYKELGQHGRLFAAFKRAFERIKNRPEGLRGSGIILWSAQSLIDIPEEKTTRSPVVSDGLPGHESVSDKDKVEVEPSGLPGGSEAAQESTTDQTATPADQLGATSQEDEKDGSSGEKKSASRRSLSRRSTSRRNSTHLSETRPEESSDQQGPAPLGEQADLDFQDASSTDEQHADYSPKNADETYDPLEMLGYDIQPLDELNYSLLHNGDKIFQKFLLTPASKKKLNVTITVALESGSFRPLVWRKSMIVHEEVVDLKSDVRLPLFSDSLQSLREIVNTSIHIKAEDTHQPGRTFFEDTHPVSILPINAWKDSEEGRHWLVSFVTPGDSAVPRIIHEAQKYLNALNDDHASGFDGYQQLPFGGEDHTVVDCQVQAIWWALVQEFNLAYINPPPSFRRQIQRLRLPSDILEQGRGTCIDLSLLLCACLEFIDIYPVIFLLTGHAFLGYWRSDLEHQEFWRKHPKSALDKDVKTGLKVGGPSVDDKYELFIPKFPAAVELVKSGRVVPLESVFLSNHSGFWHAVDEGESNLSNPKEFDGMFDIKYFREEKNIHPLPILKEDA